MSRAGALLKPPPRSRLARHCAGAVLVVLALACAGCLGGGSSKPAAGGTRTGGAPVQNPERRFGEARPVAVRYLRALALGRAAEASAFARPSGAGARRALARMGSWFTRLPIRALQASGGQVAVLGADVAAVRVSLEARFGARPPYSAWVKLGERSLELTRRGGRWWVSGDAAGKLSTREPPYGLSLLRRPRFVQRAHVTVVYEGAEPAWAARAMGAVAESVAPGLVARYGGGRAARRPVLFVVADRGQGERLADVQIGRAETPEGWQVGLYAYVDLPEWLDDDDAGRGAVVVHELTHVATRGFLRGAPQSLLEGTASYEEDAYLRRRGYFLPVSSVASAFARGWSGAGVWRSQRFDWGLDDPARVELAYQDGLVMVRAIVQDEGVAALRRLAAAFRARASGGWSAGDVRDAFRAALHRSFAEVQTQAVALSRQGGE